MVAKMKVFLSSMDTLTTVSVVSVGGAVVLINVAYIAAKLTH